MIDTARSTVEGADSETTYNKVTSAQRWPKIRVMRSEPAPNVQRYREEARRIRRDADRFKSESIRRQVLDIAAQYDKLAENLEREPRN
jgi:hypothetical protein